MKWIFELLSSLAATGFTGKIEINFFKGSVGNINKFESIVAPK